MLLWKDQRLHLAVTRLGLEYLAAMLLLGACAVNTGNNLLYLVFALMLGLFLVSGWVSRRALRDLDLAGLEEGNLFARIQGGIKVRFRDRAPARVRCLEVRLVLDRGKAEPAFYPGGGRGGEERQVVLEACPEDRGACRARALEVRTTFPFGFLEKARRFPLDEELLVLPHPRPGPAGAEPGGEPGPARPGPGGASPDGARPFKERDPLGRVHWKRTAQRGTPWVRTFEDEAPAGLRLRLDLRAWAPGPAFERELEHLSGGILRARLQRRDVNLVVESVAGCRSYQGCTPCWRALALAEPDASVDPGSALP
jgi:uncharacterized protein (DUF58 family)